MRKPVLVVFLLFIVVLIACDRAIHEFQLQFSSTRLFLNDNTEKIYLYDFKRELMIVTADRYQTLWDLDVSRDGRFLYYDSNDGIRKIDLVKAGDGTVIRHPLSLDLDFLDLAKIKAPPSKSLSVSFRFSVSPDQRHIAIVQSIDRAGTTKDDPHNKNRLDRFDHIPDVAKGPYYFVAKELSLLETRTGKCWKIADICDPGKPSWLPDSQALLFGAENSIYKYSLSSGKTDLLMAGSFPSLSPDGSSVAYFRANRFCWGPLSSEVPEHNLDYVKQLKVNGAGRHLLPVSVWSPDGKYLLFSIDVGSFFTTKDFCEIHILDAGSGKIIYKDRIPDHRGYICWTRKLE